MIRTTLTAALAALCFLAAAAPDSDACGGGNGLGLFRGRFAARSSHYGRSSYHSRASFSSTYSAAPATLVAPKAGGCVSGCPCPNSTAPQAEQKTAVVYPQSFRTVTTFRSRASGGCANGGCAVAR